MESSELHYLNHLTEVSKSNKVVLAEDIYNQRGLLVVKKGIQLDKSVAQKIVKHKLVKPLEHSISLAEPLNQRTAYAVFTSHMNKMQLPEIVRQSGFLQDALETFHLLTRYPLITQKLSVLAARLPDVFARSLSTAVMAIALCKELKQSARTIEVVFLANLLSDVGLLHIAPQIVNKKGQYSQEEWNMMQGHVAIAKHFADMVPNLPKGVARAVLEHHERLDGFGYPFGKQGEQLALEGQIIAMVDKASALYRKLIKQGPYSWTAVIAVMQVPSAAYNVVIHQGMMRLLKSKELKYQPAFLATEFPSLVVDCIEKRERLNLWFKEFSRIF